jgi:hypothetical protein
MIKQNRMEAVWPEQGLSRLLFIRCPVKGRLSLEMYGLYTLSSIVKHTPARLGILRCDNGQDGAFLILGVTHKNLCESGHLLLCDLNSLEGKFLQIPYWP